MEENIPSLRKYTLESLGVRDHGSYNISSDILPKKIGVHTALTGVA